MDMVQLIGFLGLTVCVLGSCLPRKRQILCASIIGMALFITHYLLIGAYTGAAVDLLTLLRNASAAFYHPRVLVLFFYAAPILLLALYPFNTSTVIVCTASLINTHGSFRPTAQGLRLCAIASSPFWFYYNYTHNSYAGVTGDILGFVVNVLSFLYYSRTTTALVMAEE